MVQATLPYFNLLSSELTDAYPIAIYDLSFKNGLSYDETTTRSLNSLPTPYVMPTPDLFEYYEIPCSWTLSAEPAYYLRRKDHMYVDLPVSMGIPLNYGGTQRMRFKMLSDAIVEEEPILLFPSYGLGREYAGSALTLEFWMNTEPYASIATASVLPETITKPVGEVNEFVVDSGDANVNSASIINLYQTSGTTRSGAGSPKITFVDSFSLSGSNNYVIKFKAANSVRGNVAHVTLNFSDGSSQTVDVPLDRYDFSTEFSNEYMVDEFIAPLAESVPLLGEFQPAFNNAFTTSQSSIENQFLQYEAQFDSLSTISTLPTTLSFGTINTAAVTEIDLGFLNVPMESAHKESIIMEIGGPDGGIIRLSADAFYMYLRGYGEVDSYQIGEWARPMYICCVEERESFDVYIDADKVLSISKTNRSVHFDDPVIGNWIVFFGSPLFKYMEFSTVAIYPRALHSDIQKYHHYFSYGTSYNEIIAQSEYNRAYIADGSATEFISRHVFPLTHHFSEGIGEGVQISNTISLPNYNPFEVVVISPDTGAVVEAGGVDIIEPKLAGYSKYYAKFKQLGKFHINKVATNISNIFVRISTVDFKIGEIFRVTLPNTNFICTFTLDQLAGEFNLTGSITGPTVSTDSEVWWTVAGSTLTEFTIVLDLDKLAKSANVNVSSLFVSKNLVVEFDNQVNLLSIGAATRDIMNLNAVSVPYDSNYDGVALVQDVDILGKINYLAYINKDKMIDVAASGYWTVSMPLTNFVTMVGGKPDLDFLLYFDQSQSPQLVAKLSTQYSTYKEVDTYVHSTLAAMAAETPDLGANNASYRDAQVYAGGDTPTLKYRDIDTGVSANIPTLGRFSNNPIHTYVTLDSQYRWPNKNYTKLKTEYATSSNNIDFNNSTNSVVDTKWEIFDGWAIQIPAGIDLLRYSLRYAVHISTDSMISRRPSLRRFEVYGISSGTNPINAISTGMGNYIVVGSGDEIGLEKQYSTHLTAEKVQPNLFSRELGFYPHYNNYTGKVIPISYYLGDTEKLWGLSLYFYWKGETFKTTGDFTEPIARFRYLIGTTNTYGYIDVFVKTIEETRYAYQRANITLSVPTAANIYVDTVLDGQLEAGRWHLIHFTPKEGLPQSRVFQAGNRSVKLIQVSDKAVFNYVTSHASPIEPQSLYASRFGTTNIDLFPLEPDPNDKIVTQVFDEATVLTLSADPYFGTSGPQPDTTVRITLDNNLTL